MKRQKLIEYRGSRTQTEMAKLYGVSQQTWSGWENDGINPPPHIMKAMEDDSGIPMEELFFDSFYKEIRLPIRQEA